MSLIGKKIKKYREEFQQKEKSREDKKRKSEIMALLTEGLSTRESIEIYEEISRRFRLEKKEQFAKIAEEKRDLKRFLV